MNGPDLVVGKKYALRRRQRDHACPVERITYIGPRRGGQVKVRWLDGDDEGLETWVRTQQILCPWGERRAVLRDEERFDALMSAYRRDRDPVVEEAIDLVMTSSGDGVFWRVWHGTPDQIERLWARSKLKRDPRGEALAFQDRHGEWQMSYATALRWAQAFAANEPQTVNLYVDHLEDEAFKAGFAPGNYWEHEYLQAQRPSIALARDWTGKNVHQHLTREIDHLRGVAVRAISYLEEKGHTDYARRLEKEMKGH